jgi:hypothetical protein
MWSNYLPPHEVISDGLIVSNWMAVSVHNDITSYNLDEGYSLISIDVGHPDQRQMNIHHLLSWPIYLLLTNGYITIRHSQLL